MKTFHLLVSTPDGNVFDGQVTSLSLMGTEGSLAILADHVPFITAIKPGACKIILENGEVKNGKVNSGILTVNKQVTTLISSSFNWQNKL